MNSEQFHEFISFSAYFFRSSWVANNQRKSWISFFFFYFLPLHKHLSASNHSSSLSQSRTRLWVLSTRVHSLSYKNFPESFFQQSRRYRLRIRWLSSRVYGSYSFSQLIKYGLGLLHHPPLDKNSVTRCELTKTKIIVSCFIFFSVTHNELILQNRFGDELEKF